jgi:glycosyltransferase involved in cell wall biosynthesis
MTLVSIAIPTHNRRDLLERALDSALAQTHAPIEVVISDNHSTDGTADLCRERAAADDRIRYLRLPVNEGPVRNFNAVLTAAGGAYVMALADDDWLEPDYVQRCLAVHQAEGGHALVAGRARYWDGARHVRDSTDHDHASDAPGRRVLEFWRTVDDAACFYGLIPAQTLRRLLPLEPVIAFDWLFCARAAALGRVRTVRDTTIHRSVGGTSVSRETMSAQVGIPRLQVQLSPLFIAWFAFVDIVRPAGVLTGVALPRRVALGARAAGIVLRRFLTLSAIRRRLAG